jgi:hypothetical protein
MVELQQVIAAKIRSQPELQAVVSTNRQELPGAHIATLERLDEQKT